MSEYIPTDTEVRVKYKLASGIPGDQADGEFDRWLKEVQYAAWTEGARADLGDVNPYRVERYCPTCSGASKETIGLVCQTCGRDWGER